MPRIKEKLLSFYTKRLSKTRRIERTNVGFRQAQSIGILYTGDSAKKQQIVQRLVSQLQQLGKQVTILCCAKASKAIEKTNVPTITYQDIQLLGKIIHPQARAFVNTPFDYLYQIDVEGHPVLDYLLAKSQARCRVGYYTAARAGLFEMMVMPQSTSASSKLEDLIAQMLHYTQLLKAK